MSYQQPPLPILIPSSSVFHSSRASVTAIFPNSLVGEFRTLYTMAKKVVSSALHKKKPIQRSNKPRRLRSIFRKFFNYMKSDTYMFSPLIRPQSSATFSISFDEGIDEPIKRKEKKLIQGLEEYLKRDCYMYSPLVLGSTVENPGAPPIGMRSRRKENPSVRCDLIEQTSEKTMRDSGNKMDCFRESERDDCHTPSGQIAIKHAPTQKEAVKHAVQKNCRPKSMPGKGLFRRKWLFRRETRKIVVE